MKVFKEWQWKYKIYFNQSIKEELIIFANQFKEEEKEILNEIISFYEGFYTFQILLDALDNKEENQQKEIVKKALDNIGHVLRLPDSLKEYYANEAKKYTAFKKELNFILKKALEKEDQKLKSIELLKIVFGKHYNPLYNHILNVSIDENISYEKKPIKNENITAHYYECLDVVKNVPFVLNEFGKMSNNEYDVIVKNEDGFGEWWDKDIYEDYKNDTLVLFKNSKSLNEDDFLYTIIHEAYPGHGYFFKQAKLGKKDKLFDSGAMFLIEGYATFVEFFINISDYSKFLKQQYSKIALSILDYDFKTTTVEDIELERNLTQYVGYKESYYWGAFMIDYFIKSKKYKNIKEFLDFLKENNISDLFKLW